MPGFTGLGILVRGVVAEHMNMQHLETRQLRKHYAARRPTQAPHDEARERTEPSYA
jgi:hypothetical protein